MERKMIPIYLFKKKNREKNKRFDEKKIEIGEIGLGFNR